MLRRKIHDPAFIAAHRTEPKHFTRNRCITFPVLIGFLLGAFKGDLQSLLNTFLSQLTGSAGQLAGRSALSQARYKLLSSAFIELNRLVLDWLAENLPEPRWFGFRLVAGDGTTLHLPDSGWTGPVFGVSTDEHGNRCVMARAFGLFAVAGRRLLGAEIEPYTMDERSMLVRCLDALGGSDLLLLDRGFPARWLFAYLVQRGIPFCIRGDSSQMAELKTFIRSGLSEQILRLTLSLHDQRRADSYDVTLDAPQVTLRLVRVVLPSGQIEVLITSLLDVAVYPASLFGPLYHQRWRIEECFKTLKARLRIEQFTGTMVEAIDQDFYARILQMNIAAALCQSVEAALPVHQRGRVQIIFSFALNHLQWRLGCWLVAGLDLDSFAATLETLAKNLNWLRPPRSFPRKATGSKSKSRMEYR